MSSKEALQLACCSLLAVLADACRAAEEDKWDGSKERTAQSWPGCLHVWPQENEFRIALKHFCFRLCWWEDYSQLMLISRQDMEIQALEQKSAKWLQKMLSHAQETLDTISSDPGVLGLISQSKLLRPLKSTLSKMHLHACGCEMWVCLSCHVYSLHVQSDNASLSHVCGGNMFHLSQWQTGFPIFIPFTQL